MRFRKNKVRLKDGSKVTAFLDTSVEMNVMTKELMEEANLTMKKRSKLELVLYTDQSRHLQTFREDVKVVIRDRKIKHLIFVVEVGDQDLVLAQSFLNFEKFCQEYKPDEIFNTIIYSHMH